MIAHACKILALVIVIAVSAMPLGAESTNRVSALTLHRAIQLAEQNSPELARAHALAAVADGRAQQAGKWPNPELIVRAESLGATDGEYLAGFGQDIPIGASPGKARQVENLERERLLREAEVEKFQLRRNVQAAFATALFQSRARDAVLKMAENAAKAVELTKRRVEAGDALPTDLARTEMEAARTQAELRRSRSLEEQSFIELATVIGNPGLEIASLHGKLEAVFAVPTIEALSRDVAAHPAIAASAAAVRAEQARLDLENARKVPNIRAELLYRRVEDQGRDGFDIGFSIPLPLFDRNSGNIRAAEAEVAAAEAQAQARSNELHGRMRQAHAQLNAALAALRLQKDEMLPRAEKILQMAEMRYANGDISLSEVLMARRDRAELELSHLEALREATAAWGELAVFLKE